MHDNWRLPFRLTRPGVCQRDDFVLRPLLLSEATSPSRKQPGSWKPSIPVISGIGTCLQVDLPGMHARQARGAGQDQSPLARISAVACLTGLQNGTNSAARDAFKRTCSRRVQDMHVHAQSVPSGRRTRTALPLTIGEGHAGRNLSVTRWQGQARNPVRSIFAGPFSLISSKALDPVDQRHHLFPAA